MIPVMVEYALQWPTMGGTYLEVLGCLGAALVDLLGGVMDFKTVDAFGIILETCIDFGTCELERCRGSRGAERTDRFKQIFSMMSTFNIVLTALETLRHMLDFKSSASCFGFG